MDDIAYARDRPDMLLMYVWSSQLRFHKVEAGCPSMDHEAVTSGHDTDAHVLLDDFRHSLDDLSA